MNDQNSAIKHSYLNRLKREQNARRFLAQKLDQLVEAIKLGDKSYIDMLVADAEPLIKFATRRPRRGRPSKESREFWYNVAVWRLTEAQKYREEHELLKEYWKTIVKGSTITSNGTGTSNTST